MTWGLEKYGHRTMLIAWFLAVAILSFPSIYFLRGRLAPQEIQQARNIGFGSFTFIGTPVFFLLQGGNIIQALGNFLPGIHLPSEHISRPHQESNTDHLLPSLCPRLWSLTP